MKKLLLLSICLSFIFTGMAQKISEKFIDYNNYYENESQWKKFDFSEQVMKNIPEDKRKNIMHYYKEEFGLTEKDSIAVSPYPVGKDIVLCEQYHNGYKIENARAIIHYQDGVPTKFTGTYFEGLDLKADVKITEKDALEIALKNVPGKKFCSPSFSGKMDSDPIGRLLWTKKRFEKQYVLAWKFSFVTTKHSFADCKYYDVYIDAEKGVFYNSIDNTSYSCSPMPDDQYCHCYHAQNQNETAFLTESTNVGILYYNNNGGIIDNHSCDQLVQET